MNIYACVLRELWAMHNEVSVVVDGPTGTGEHYALDEYLALRDRTGVPGLSTAALTGLTFHCAVLYSALVREGIGCGLLPPDTDYTQVLRSAQSVWRAARDAAADRPISVSFRQCPVCSDAREATICDMRYGGIWTECLGLGCLSEDCTRALDTVGVSLVDLLELDQRCGIGDDILTSEESGLAPPAVVALFRAAELLAAAWHRNSGSEVEIVNEQLFARSISLILGTLPELLMLAEQRNLADFRGDVWPVLNSAADLQAALQLVFTRRAKAPAAS